MIVNAQAVTALAGYLGSANFALKRTASGAACSRYLLVNHFPGKLKVGTLRPEFWMRCLQDVNYRVLNELQLSLRPEKTFEGRSLKGFDSQGYHITHQGITPSQATQENAFEKAKWRYAQGGKKPLRGYLNHWGIWIHAGLPSYVCQVDCTIQHVCESVISSNKTAA